VEIAEVEESDLQPCICTLVKLEDSERKARQTLPISSGTLILLNIQTRPNDNIL
jgi:hypothetical protein